MSTADLEHVLYGSRNADLLDFLHGDLPKQARKATPAKASRPKPRPSKLPAEQGAEEPEEAEGAEGAAPPAAKVMAGKVVAGKENAAGTRRKAGKAAAAANVQSTNMHSFFSKSSATQVEERGVEERGGSGQLRGVKRPMRGGEEADMDDELLEDEGGEEARADAATRTPTPTHP